MKLEKILGPSRDGQWMDDEDFASLRAEEEEEEEEEENGSESDGQSMFYCVITVCSVVKHVLTCKHLTFTWLVVTLQT